MKLKFNIPKWLVRLIAPKFLDKMQERSKLTGESNISWGGKSYVQLKYTDIDKKSNEEGK